MQGLEAVFYTSQKINANTGSDRPVDEDDTIKAKHAFKSIGYYDEPSYGMTPYPDQPLFDGIKKFQKDKDLYQDALMEPGGETVTTLNKELGKLNSNSPVKPAAFTPGKKVRIQQLEVERAKVQNKIGLLFKDIFDESDPVEKERLTKEFEEQSTRLGEIDRELKSLREQDREPI